MTKDTKLSELVINKLTTTQYDGIATKDPNQLYVVTDAPGFEESITNCITEIPQDIKLELVDGTLTLKAGSKVWIPYGTTEAYKVGDTDAYGNTVVATSWDGSKFFYVIELQSDLTYSDPYNGNWIIVYCANDNTIKLAEDGGSGTTTPSGNGYYYNTSTNKIDYYRQTSATGWVCSFPLIKVTSTATQITSIDQTFNGFGYIGSTIFALPGVKGLIPDGRNADGSLRNIEFTTSSVLTFTNTYANVQNAHWLITSSVLTINGAHSYNEAQNLNYNQTTVILACEFAISQTDSNGRITDWNPKTAFHTLNWNDSSTISGWSMPSDRYINLPVGASSSSYTAPANGWFNFVHEGSNGQWIFLTNQSNGFEVDGTINGQGYARIFIPCKKGDIIRTDYSTTGSYKRLNFYYAEGEN